MAATAGQVNFPGEVVTKGLNFDGLRGGGIEDESSFWFGLKLIVDCLIFLIFELWIEGLVLPFSATQTTVGQLRWLGNEATVGQVRLLGEVVVTGLNFDGLREVG